MAVLFSRKAKGAALVAALFSAHLPAQEQVMRGNAVAPHQPPTWFARMAQPEAFAAPEIDGFIVAVTERPMWHGKLPRPDIKYPCKPEKDNQGVLRWQFCEM